MSNKTSYRVPPEVKADIIKRVKEEGVSVAQAAKDHGIHESTIYGWLGVGATSAPSWAEVARLQKQNRELFEVVGELTVKLSAAQKKN
jgi:transposase-like protein